jgi:hypothetical protein
VVAGAAALGSSATGGAKPSAAIASPAGDGSLKAAVGAVTGSAIAEPRRLVLFQPSDGLVTTRELLVSGSVVDEADRLAIILESRGAKPLSMTTVAAESPFSVTLPIPIHRDGTPLNVRVIAYDVDGQPIDVVGRQVIIGPYVPRSIGGDGFIGGIVFGSSWDERRGDP